MPGDKGERGNLGLQGEAGVSGQDGPPGDDGPPGPPGLAGELVNIDLYSILYIPVTNSTFVFEIISINYRRRR